MPRAAPDPGKELLKDLHFPKAGVDVSQAAGKQPNRPVADGTYARTTPSAVNVRAWQPSTNRARGGSRPGLSKWVPLQVAGTSWVVQHLELLVGTFPNPGGSVAQSSLSGRVVLVVAVSQGNVYTAKPTDVSWTAATNATIESPPLNATGIIFSTSAGQKLWFADGINAVFYDPPTNSVKPWVASAGQLPVDSANNRPKLICTWRGRVVQSGLLLDPQDWFMSRVDDPTNYDYAPVSPGPKDAVAGQNAPQGLVGDVITALIPYSDDVLIFGGDHTLWMMRGDPLAGGSLDLISDSIGMAWGRAFCKDPYGNLWFVSNRTGIYTLRPGEQPVRVSQQIEATLQNIDTGTNSIRLVWDDRWQGLHVFVTPLSAPGVSTHFYYDQRNGAWFTDQFGNTNLDPLSLCVLDGNLPGDRAVLLGGWDGYVRKLDPSAVDDDGTSISSSVLIGPLVTPVYDDIQLDKVQGVLGVGSGNVTVQLLSGNTAEAALAATPLSVGTLSAGRGFTFPTRKSAGAHYLKLSSTVQWAMESLKVKLTTLGKVRRRGR